MLAAMTHPSRVLNLDMKAKLCMPKSYIYIYIYIYSDKTFKSVIHVSTDFCHLQLINVQSVGSWIYRVSRTMLIMINDDNKKIKKAWKCENKKYSFRFTWCNCWFKDGCPFWIWIASLILSWKLVEAWSKTRKLSAEHKAHCRATTLPKLDTFKRLDKISIFWS